MSKIIFLNGCGSSGKTSIARSIQYLSGEPWLRLGVDTFIDMMPDKFIAFGEKAKDGYFAFIPGQNERGPTMHVESTSLGNKFFNCVAPDIAALLAEHGNNLIIDEVLFGDEALRLYTQHLWRFTVYFIGIFCKLQTMQEREILRGGRAIGLANDQIDRVHMGVREYDLKIDTSNLLPFAAASSIIEFINKTPNPNGFHCMRQLFGL